MCSQVSTKIPTMTDIDIGFSGRNCLTTYDISPLKLTAFLKVSSTYGNVIRILDFGINSEAAMFLSVFFLVGLPSKGLMRIGRLAF